jgi:predicted kinase
MHPARVVIVCGLPGAGKTTRATELATRFGAVRMSPDDWLERLAVDVWDETVRGRIEAIQGDLTVDLLRAGTSIVVEWGTWMRSEREVLRRRAIDAGALVHLEFLDAPVDTLWERVRLRGREQRPGIGSRAITRDDIVAWSDTIERPDADELAMYDPLPPVTAGERPASPTYPYGGWGPQSRPR